VRGATCNAPGEAAPAEVAAPRRVGPTARAQLLKHGAEIDLVDSDRGWTPLICAAAHNQLAVVNVLLDAGARADIADLDQWTAHDHAIFEGYMECGATRARRHPTRACCAF